MKYWLFTKKRKKSACKTWDFSIAETNQIFSPKYFF
jgi:hypothetical protein